MLSRLKQTAAVKALYRSRNRPVIGAPARAVMHILKLEWLQIDHLRRANRRHNAAQRDVLRAFNAETRRRAAGNSGQSGR
ncbi:hypothetical protein [Poseidonocella sedimentorum]|uniref:hypothetical protein n=1 Tax=Poseidonocella sedimentorum TaxID=871652 RepID=UPI0011607B57|nr:hypothetical protein [Poseidonocella sedimentorum]